MLIEFRWFGCFEDVFGPGNFSGSPMRDEKILIHLDGGFISQDAVFRYSDAEQRSSQNTHAASHYCTLQRSNDGGRDGAGDEERTNSGNPEKSRTEQQAPQATPQCPHLSPILHPVSAVVVAYNVFLGVIIFADDG